MRTCIRWVGTILTGLWVTTGVAVPIGFLLLNLIKANNDGQLGPELLSRPSIILILLAGYAVAAMIGGWAAGWVAGWVAIEDKRRLANLLSLSHVGAWLFAALAGAVTFPTWLTIALSGAAVIGTFGGVGIRLWQVGRRSRIPDAGR